MEDSYSSKTLDHLGLVAGMFDELGLGEMIDSACPSDSPEWFAPLLFGLSTGLFSRIAYSF